VIDGAGEHRTISSGPLPAAVAASAAIPCIFSPVPIPGKHALLLPAASAFW
jgi:predicted acylesterase/phospholipase RssA